MSNNFLRIYAAAKRETNTLAVISVLEMHDKKREVWQFEKQLSEWELHNKITACGWHATLWGLNCALNAILEDADLNQKVNERALTIAVAEQGLIDWGTGKYPKTRGTSTTMQILSDLFNIPYSDIFTGEKIEFVKLAQMGLDYNTYKSKLEKIMNPITPENAVIALVKPTKIS